MCTSFYLDKKINTVKDMLLFADNKLLGVWNYEKGEIGVSCITGEFSHDIKDIMYFNIRLIP